MLRQLFCSLVIAIIGTTLWLTTDCQARQLHMMIRLLKGSPLEYEHAGAASGCVIRPGHSCNGIFWIGETESGVSGGSMTSMISEPSAEFLYELSVKQLERDYLLSASIFNLHVDSEGKISGGRQFYSESPISLDSQLTVDIGEDLDGIRYLLGITLSDRPIPMSEENEWDGSNVTLLSRQLVDGKSWSVAKNSTNAIHQTTSFTATFSSNPSAEGYMEMKYRFLLSFEDLPERIDGPVRTTLNIVRQYAVSSRGASSSQQGAYSSTYSKQIELRPGKLTELVIPPDTPSVAGFDILDTLRILPANTPE